MLNEKEIKELLKAALKKYIQKLEISSLDYNEYGTEVKVYMRVLSYNEKSYKYLDIDKAKKILKELN